MEPPSRHVVNVLNQTGVSVDTEPIAHAVAVALRHVHADPIEVAVLLTSSDEVRRLNARYRGLDQETDVLTFVDTSDIAIAYEYAKRQAAVRGVLLEQELAYLAIHGALHLSGLEDESEDERRYMLQVMNEVARCLGIPEDYEWGSLLHEESAV